MSNLNTAKDSSDKLSDAQQRAIGALLTTRTIKDAAQSARVGRTTLFRWLREDEDFRRCLQAARRNALGQATARLQRMAVNSVDSLQQIIADDKSSTASRVSGIRATLDYAYRAIELEEIEERLTRIEEAITAERLLCDLQPLAV